MSKPKVGYGERPKSLEFTDVEIVVTLANERVVRNPLSGHPWLAQATPAQRQHYQLSTFSIDWPELDEGLDVEGMIRGIPSDPEQRHDIERLSAIVGDPQKRESLLSFLDLLNRTPA